MIIYYSVPQPYATKGIVVPLIVALLTAKPFWVIYIIRNRIIKYKKSKELENNNGDIILVDEKHSLNNEENNEKENNTKVVQKL